MNAIVTLALSDKFQKMEEQGNVTYGRYVSFVDPIEAFGMHKDGRLAEFLFRGKRGCYYINFINNNLIVGPYAVGNFTLNKEQMLKRHPNWQLSSQEFIDHIRKRVVDEWLNGETTVRIIHLPSGVKDIWTQCQFKID